MPEVLFFLVLERELLVAGVWRLGPVSSSLSGSSISGISHVQSPWQPGHLIDSLCTPGVIKRGNNTTEEFPID